MKNISIIVFLIVVMTFEFISYLQLFLIYSSDSLSVCMSGNTKTLKGHRRNTCVKLI